MRKSEQQISRSREVIVHYVFTVNCNKINNEVNFEERNARGRSRDIVAANYR